MEQDKLVHDIPMAEMDGQHVKSIYCPCAPDVEQVTLRAAIVYHTSLKPSKRWTKLAGGARGHSA